MSDEVDVPDPSVEELIEIYPNLKEYVKHLEEQSNSHDTEEVTIEKLVEKYPKLKDINYENLIDIFPSLKSYVDELTELAESQLEMPEPEPQNNIQGDAKEEIEKLREKNKEKLKEINDLNDQNDKLKSQLEQSKNNNKTLQKKVSTLENDLEENSEKIRQIEAELEDKDSQLTFAQEQFINLAQQFEDYKIEKENDLHHVEQELVDAKNDIVIKDKTIERLNKKQLMTQAIMNSTHPVDNNPKRNPPAKRMSVQVNIANIGKFNPNNVSLNSVNNSQENISANSANLRICNSDRRGSIGDQCQQAPVITPYESSKTNSNNKPNYPLNEKEKISAKLSAKSFKHLDMSKDNADKISEKDESESEKEKSNPETKTSFTLLEPEQSCIVEIISVGKRPFISAVSGDVNSLKNDKKITENLREMLRKIQERKKYLLTHKKNINEKLQKLGIKIR